MMMGRRIFSPKGNPIKNISFQISCITGLPPQDTRWIPLRALHEIAKQARSYGLHVAGLDLLQVLMNLWMSLMPVGVQLEGPPGLNYSVIVTRSANKLQDRKSTRLNSSHSQISYAVFCLKKKKLIV